MERVEIFIDGANFHHLVLKKIEVAEIQFDFSGFAAFLANGRPFTEMGKRFYIGAVRAMEGDEKSKQDMATQIQFLTALRNEDWTTKTSKLRRRKRRIKIDDRITGYTALLEKGVIFIEVLEMHEKGIDVKIATDLIVGAIDNQYDTAIVVSSDSDLHPALDWVRKRCGKKVEYVGFSLPAKKDWQDATTPLITMNRYSDIQRSLVESDLKSFIKSLPL